MVSYHECYITQGMVAQELETLDMAVHIAETILAHFDLRDLKQYEAFLAWTEMFDKGEEVYIHKLLNTLI